MHCRHPRQLYAVFNDVVNLAVRQALRFVGMEIWDAGILIRADRRRAPAIDTVTGGATGKKRISSLLQRNGIADNGIESAAFCSRNCKVAQRAGHRALEGGGTGRSPESPPLDEKYADCPQRKQTKTSYCYRSRNSHRAKFLLGPVSPAEAVLGETSR